MELSGSNIKKLFMFQETEFSYISGNENPKKLLIFQEVTFQARKMKKINLEKISYILGNGNSEKNFLYFLKKKAVLIFWKTKTPKNRFIFQETEPSYI